jgi:hypothetical protein
MNPECLRIADQLRRAFIGEPWHGDPLSELLADITAKQAYARPLPSGHSIWELILHIDAYVKAAYEVTEGIPMPQMYKTPRDWPPVSDSSTPEWTVAKEGLFESAERLAAGIDGFADERLADTVPGREYDFYYLFHGIVQHSLYHGGQIAMLKRATSAA